MTNKEPLGLEYMRDSVSIVVHKNIGKLCNKIVEQDIDAKKLLTFLNKLKAGKYCECHITLDEDLGECTLCGVSDKLFRAA